MISIYESIFKRKSVRKYEKTPLSKEILDNIIQFADKIKPLNPDIKIEYEIIEEAKNASVKAPHYIAIYSEQNGDWLENAGFMFEQMALYIASIGLGACWIGMGKPEKQAKSNLTLVILIAFGTALENPYRETAAFSRKALSEISSGQDSRIEAVRLAPSAVNSQNWFFKAESGKIDVYQKKAPAALALIYNKMNRIDIGIALAHLYIATEKENRAFVFEKTGEKSLKGYIYKGTVL